VKKIRCAGADLRPLILAAALAALILAILAPGAFARDAYVANHNDNDVSVIDTATNTVVGSPILVGNSPKAIAITPDGSRAFALNSKGDDVSVIDTATNAVVGSPVTVGTRPEGIAITPDGGRAYVTNSESNDVSVIDTATDTVLGAPIVVGKHPEGITITPDGSRAYVANLNDNDISVIDTATETVVGLPIMVEQDPGAIAITPDGNRLYVVNFDSETVSVIDTATGTVVGSIPVGVEPEAIAISPDGSRAYIVNHGSNDVSVINTVTNKVIGLVEVGAEPEAIAITPDGSRAYVSNSDTDNVAVINTATDTVIGSPIKVAANPAGIAITPNQPPTASFVPVSAMAGVPLIFNAAASSDPDGQIATYSWAFGDGQTTANGGPNPTHTFSTPGTYQTTLTTTDNEGCSTSFVFTGQTAFCNGSSLAAQTQTITVLPPSNIFRFGRVRLNKRRGTARLAVHFPGPGQLFLVGRQVRVIQTKVARKGTVNLTIRPKIELNKALKKRHQASVRFRLTFTPTDGTARTQSKALKLIHRH
jgi:YVTN family beta-propeller protein